MSLAKQIGELCDEGFTVNMLTSPAEEEGKLCVMFLLTGKPEGGHLNHDGHIDNKLLDLVKKPIQLPLVTPDELEDTIIAELKPVIEERVPISNSIKDAYDELHAKRAKARGNDAKAGHVAKKKPTAKERAITKRAEAEKASGADLPLFESSRSVKAKAKESLKESITPKEEEFDL